jgi:transcriptional regulator with XRE-family HTH domain
VAKAGPPSLHPSQLEARSPAAIGERLCAVRKALGLTQEQLAASVGCPQGTFGQYEAGMRKPSIAVASRLYDRHGITLDYLYLGNVGTLPFELGKAVTRFAVKL